MIGLRDYQITAIESARRIIAGGSKAVLINAPTGSGKTVMAASIVKSAVAKGKTVLFLAHRRELIEQCSAKLTEAGVINHGVIMAGSGLQNGLAPVQVASIQTLIRRELPPADIVVIDECHRAVAGSYKTILANFPQAIVLGLTATPERLDGKGLDTLFNSMVSVDTVPGLIERGYLVKPDCYVGTEADLSGVKMRAGDYREGELQDAMDKPQLIGDIVKNWKLRANGKPTIAFASGVEHSKHISQEFMNAGVSAASVDGTMSASARAAIIADWKSGVIKVVSNCMIFTEGFDFPALECAILARPTQSVSLYLQMAGRIMRSHPGKTSAIILDHAGCATSHGGPHIERIWTLEGEQERRKEANTENTCPVCTLRYDAESKYVLSEVQDRLPAKLIPNARKMMKENKGISVCPGCSSATCIVCNNAFHAKSAKTNIDGIATITETSCQHCSAAYTGDVPHIDDPEEDKDDDGIPQCSDAELRLLGDEIPINVKVKNDFKRLLNEARSKGWKRGAIWHRLREQYDEPVLRECLPRHRGEWWRQAA